MVEHAHDSDQIIGMIQPLGSQISHDVKSSDLFGTAPRGRDLYQVGCVGKISEFEKTVENQYFIVLKGMSRFSIRKEMPMIHQYREAEVCYSDFRQDGLEGPVERNLKSKFHGTLETYLKHLDLKFDPQTFNEVSDEEFVNSLAMVCPFDASEKQLLIEALSLKERTTLMIKIMNFNLAKHDISSDDHVH